MNARQSLAGFDFIRFNQEYIARQNAANGADGNGSSGNSSSGNGAAAGGNDAARYDVRIVRAEVAAGQRYWRVVGVRHLEPAENKGKHNLYAELLDEEGKRVRDPNYQLQRGWEGQRPDESAPPVRFDKGENEPAANVPIDRNQRLWVSVSGDLPSDRVENLHTKHADEPGPGGELWNSIGHHSFYVVFQRTQHAEATVPPIVSPTDVTPPVVTPPVSPPTREEVDDATYIEGRDAVPALATVQPGQRFTQSWRVKNSGSRAWGDGDHLVCVGGAQLDAPNAVPVPSCAPGDQIAINVEFVAPDTPGPHYSVWRLRNPHGETFGERLWLLVVVATAREGVTTGTPRNLRAVTTDAATNAATGRLPLLIPTSGATTGTATANGTGAAVGDPELYAAWKKHIEHGFANNQLMFQQLLNGFMNPYWTTVWMYRILFGLGVASFLVAAGLSAFTNKEGYTLIFGGLSALSLLAYFFNRPLQALEENLQFITWLGLIYNSYWTRLVYLNSQPDVQQGLQAATDDAITRIKELMDAHAKRSSKRPNLRDE